MLGFKYVINGTLLSATNPTILLPTKRLQIFVHAFNLENYGTNNLVQSCVNFHHFQLT